MLGRRPLCLCEPPRYQVSKSFTLYHYLFAFHTSRYTADRAEPSAEPSAFPCHDCNLKNNNAGEKHRKHEGCSWTITGTAGFHQDCWEPGVQTEPTPGRTCDPLSVSFLGEGETSSFTWTPCWWAALSFLDGPFQE